MRALRTSRAGLRQTSRIGKLAEPVSNHGRVLDRGRSRAPHGTMGHMNKATWAMLNESEKELLRQAEVSPLARLDEDGLLDLHTRVRRARNKYATLYRRRASSQVKADAGRAKAHAQHARTAAKAEAFEDALARVSHALAKAARTRATALRAERLVRAQTAPVSPRRAPSGR